MACTFGEKKQFELFHQLDNWQNIRYNKISALSRNEPKDLAYILFICKKVEFSWVEEIKISRTIMNWSINSLEKVNRAILPNYEALENL